ncbi:MAG: (Fe-S)-binding protein [Alphaproteobacteria bacterium]|nr:(Fe-S)-binding protein [Alphaproteobacteria bacterium]
MKQVHLFIPCFIDQLFPDVAIATYKLLRKLQVDVVYNPNQTCCGQPAYNAGFVNSCLPVIDKFYQDFKDAQLIIIPSASCVGFLKNHAPNIFSNSNNIQILELSEFLKDKLNNINLKLKQPIKLAYHSSCAALRETHTANTSKKILNHIKNLDLIEFEEEETCCGFGGSFAVKYESISTSLAKEKIEHLLVKNVNYLTSSDMSCLLHLQSYCQKYFIPIKVKHISEIILDSF